VLSNVFDKWWPDLEEKIKAAMQIQVPLPGTGRRPERDLLEEVLERVRALQLRPSYAAAPHRRPISREELAARPAAEVSIRELGLTPRAYMTMREHGIRSLADLLSASEYDLIKIPNLGRSSVIEVKHILERYGLELRPMDSSDSV
jgi:DNA-directed RNA polymerase alpha subunit